jgi:hypothetical protein
VHHHVFDVNPISFALSQKKKKNSTRFGLNPNKKTHCENVEPIVSYTTLEMKDRKY